MTDIYIVFICLNGCYLSMTLILPDDENEFKGHKAKLHPNFIQSIHFRVGVNSRMFLTPKYDIVQDGRRNEMSET